MSDSRTSNSIKNSGASVFGRLATVIMEFILRTVLIEMLGKEYAGISTLFTDILQVLSLMELGLGGAIIFALYKPLAEKDSKKVNALMHFYKTAYNIIALAVFVLGMLCVPFLDYIVKDVPNIKEDIRLIFMLYVVASSCSYLVAYKETLIRASQKARVAVRIETTVQLAFMVLECLSLLILKSFIMHLLLRIATSLVRNLLISYEVKKRFADVDFRSSDRLTGAERKKLMADVGAMALYKVSGVVLTGSDSVIVSAFLSTTTVGILGNCRIFSNFISNITNKVWNAVLPSVGNLAATKDPDRQYRVFERLTFGNYVFSCFCAVGLFVLINPVVTVWLGSDFTISTAAAAAMALNLYLILTIFPFQTFRDANGLFVQGKYRPLIMSVINVGLSLTLVRPFGLVGVLISTPISRLTTQAWFDPYIVYKEVFKRSPKGYYLGFLGHTALTALCGVGAWLLLESLPLTGFLKLIAGGVLCTGIPFVVYFVLFRKSPQFIYLISRIRQLAARVLRRKR